MKRLLAICAIAALVSGFAPMNSGYAAGWSLSMPSFGVGGFIDQDGDGCNDNAPDDDGDGIPNGIDDDYVPSCDGTGNGNGNGNGDCDGSGPDA